MNAFAPGVELNWHIPCGGDGQWICTPLPERPPVASYLAEVGRAAESAGFDSVLVPCAFGNPTFGVDAPYTDAFVAALAVIGVTRRVQVIVAHRPGFINPGVFAQMCRSADVASDGRLALNIVTAGVPGDMEQFGDVLAHDARYQRAMEFVDCLQRLWSESEVTYAGQFYQLQRARLAPPSAAPRALPLYLAGASEMAVGMAARQADVYMLTADTPAAIGQRIAALRTLAARAGRSPRFCVAAAVFARQTEAEARARAQAVVEHADLTVVADRTRAGRISMSVEDVRNRARTNIDSWLGPNLWAGLAHLTYGAAWVGSYDQIVDLFDAYAEVGVSVFQMYSYPFLEEAQNIGRNLLPLARARLAVRGGRVPC